MGKTSDKNQPDEELISKSQQKREMLALQKLGEQLTTLKPADLAKIPLEESLADAVKLAVRIRNTREGYRRQLQLIGKLMRHADADAIRQAIEQLNSVHQQGNALFHRLEKWRDELISGSDETINQWMADYPLSDRQRLRQFVRQAKKEQQQNKPPKSARELFRYLRELAEASEDK
ncbi:MULTISPECIES: ribosome biogenesis factor YjgA [Corallincola]|uniref:Dual-action ribosomal maturation protein DarP n=3 Tax=Corallincola TaxID=1775176 RepID=A0A368NJA6_9GAMM|nr:MULTISPECIES: ribosome biogenesis factor YjgA [Corallincola]RCU49845.1 ribosome-associated protein [Corallincola holothuriorum]TAA45178.1 ribosome-associated protein [Corallincola spongiicola]TCI03545.1 ribosome-associated protein [Corallincola luteus]